MTHCTFNHSLPPAPADVWRPDKPIGVAPRTGTAAPGVGGQVGVDVAGHHIPVGGLVHILRQRHRREGCGGRRGEPGVTQVAHLQTLHLTRLIHTRLRRQSAVVNG